MPSLFFQPPVSSIPPDWCYNSRVETRGTQRPVARFLPRALATLVALLVVASVLQAAQAESAHAGWHGWIDLSEERLLQLDASLLLTEAYVLAAVTLPVHLLLAFIIVTVFRLPKARIWIAFVPLWLQLGALLATWLWCGYGLPFSISGLAWVAGVVFLIADMIAVAVLLRTVRLSAPFRALLLVVLGAVWAAANLVAIPAIGWVGMLLSAVGLSANVPVGLWLSSLLLGLPFITSQ